MSADQLAEDLPEKLTLVAALKKPKFKDFTLVVNDGELFPSLSERELEEILKVPVAMDTSKPGKPAEEEVMEQSSFVALAAAAADDDKSWTVVGQPRRKLPKGMILTENSAPTFASSGDPLVDFFFHVLESTPTTLTLQYVQNAWSKDPLATLKLIAMLRDIRGGKGIRFQYQHCLYYLYQNHPMTLYKNMELLLQFGYMKDILHFLMMIQFDGFVHPYFALDDQGKGGKNFNIPGSQEILNQIIYPVKSKPSTKTKDGKPIIKVVPLNFKTGSRMGRKGRAMLLQRKAMKPAKKKPTQSDKEKRMYNQLILNAILGSGSGDTSKNAANIPKGEMVEARIQFLRKKFKEDAKYRAFHLMIAKLFAYQLYKDSLALKEIQEAQKEKGEKQEISLAGKWAPTLEGHFDRYTFVASTISLHYIQLLAKSSKEHEEMLLKPVPIATYLARKTYSKELVALRKYHEVPEVAMSEGKWDQVNYKRVPAKCMQKNRTHFIEHDKERFEAFVGDKKTKIAGATLKPVELINRVYEYTHIAETPEVLIEREVIEKQWISLVDSIKSKGGALFKNAVAICDVSGSMAGQPMMAAIGLTLITLEVTQPPWNSICLTFSEQPDFHNLAGCKTLFEKVSSLEHMHWGGNTDLHAAFIKILSMGTENKLKQEQMPSVLFIFTDMEFDQACSGSDLTNIQAAKKLFEQNGYNLPSIVLWNLRSSSSTPVQFDDRGVILLSGFSAQQLDFIMKQDDLSACDPLQFVMSVVDNTKYECLKVYD